MIRSRSVAKEMNDAINYYFFDRLKRYNYTGIEIV